MVDWTAIKARAQTGESLTAIAEDFPVSRQAISFRARREKWFESPENNPNLTPGVWLERIQKCEVKESGRTTFNPAIAAAVLSDISIGNSITTSSELHGVTKEELRSWRQSYPKFDLLVRAAIAECRKRLVCKIGGAGDMDWRANAWLLERLPDHKEEFSQNGAVGGPSGIVVNITVKRDENLAIEGGVKDVIDVTPDKQ